MTAPNGEQRPLVVGDLIAVTVTKNWLLHNNYVRGPFTLRPEHGRHLEQIGWTCHGGFIEDEDEPCRGWLDGSEHDRVPVYRLAASGRQDGAT